MPAFKVALYVVSPLDIMKGMPEIQSEFETLMHKLQRDGFVLEDLSLPNEHVLLFKCLLEAYPQMASMHAPRGRQVDGRCRLVVASPPKLHPLVSELLEDCTEACGVTRHGVWNGGVVLPDGERPTVGG